MAGLAVAADQDAAPNHIIPIADGRVAGRRARAAPTGAIVLEAIEHIIGELGTTPAVITHNLAIAGMSKPSRCRMMRLIFNLVPRRWIGGASS